jgi:uncharacterized membrane protein (DUF373 family)
MSNRLRDKAIQAFTDFWKNDTFLDQLHCFEKLIARVLSLALVVVILVALVDLCIILGADLLKPPIGFFGQSLIEIFGLFLNILIALELLENISAYLRENIIHVELVIVTALIAIARKVIIFDSAKSDKVELFALAMGALALAGSYWLVKRSHRNEQ